MAGLGWVSWRGWLALAVFALQNGLSVLIIRWSKVKNPEPYSSQVAVLAQELVGKVPVCMVLYSIECGGVLAALRSIVDDLKQRPAEWVQLSVPALLYTIQNTCIFVGYGNVEPAIGQIVYQSKILWVALFSLLVLGKKLTSTQWLALFVLALGIVAVQGLDSSSSAKPATVVAETPAMHADKLVEHAAHASHATHASRTAHAHTVHGPHASHAHSKVSAENKLDAAATSHRMLAAAQPEQSAALGVGALVLAAVCTAFASVYFEKMLKSASKPSLWLRNIQLALYSSIIAIIGLLASPDPALKERGWMAGFNSFNTWFTVLWQSLGGLIVAVTIKYSDNILRGFAQGLALIIGAFGSYILFDFHLSVAFSVGCALVIAAIFLYGAGPPTPQELCEQMAGACGVGACGGARNTTEVAPSSSEQDAFVKDDDEQQQAPAPTAEKVERA